MEDIENFVDQIMNQDLTNAGKSFNALMTDRLQGALDAQKVAIAGKIYNDEEQLEMEFEADQDDNDNDLEYNTEENYEVEKDEDL